MERFTRKIKDNFYTAYFDKEQCIEKLGLLEDILEKHNIKDLKELDNKLEALEILDQYFYIETTNIGNTIIACTFENRIIWLNDKNPEYLIRLKNYFERKEK